MVGWYINEKTTATIVIIVLHDTPHCFNYHVVLAVHV